jgi:hypothetical protein
MSGIGSRFGSVAAGARQTLTSIAAPNAIALRDASVTTEIIRSLRIIVFSPGQL